MGFRKSPYNKEPVKIVEAGMTLFDIKRRKDTAGSVYDSRSAGGIRVKGKKRKGHGVKDA